MEIVKTYLFFSGHDEDHPYLIDTIFYEGAWWLVASWLQHHSTGHRIPERIIQMDGLTVRFQEVEGHPYRFLLNNALPKSVLDGVQQEGYTMAIHPSALAESQGPKLVH
nr:hypothetical protein [Rhodoferax sp.]